MDFWPTVSLIALLVWNFATVAWVYLAEQRSQQRLSDEFFDEFGVAPRDALTMRW